MKLPFTSTTHENTNAVSINAIGPQLVSKAMSASVQSNASSDDADIGPHVFHKHPWAKHRKEKAMSTYQRRLYIFVSVFNNGEISLMTVDWGTFSFLLTIMVVSGNRCWYPWLPFSACIFSKIPWLVNCSHEYDCHLQNKESKR